MPTGKGLWDAVRRGKEIGCTSVQVFTSSPRQWSSKPVTDEQVAALDKAVTESGIDRQALVSHDTYLINVAALDPAKRVQSEEALSRELGRCAQLGIPFVVSHMGAHGGEGVPAGLDKVVDSTKRILDAAPDGVTLLMETTAGQGSSLNARFDEIGEIFDRVGDRPNLGVCFDTCHVFAAGYDLRTPETFAATMDEFDRLVGLEKIKVFHVNDSQKGLGTRVDRHAHLGDGLIGPTAFWCLVHDPRFERVPMVVETPDADTMHEVNVKRLWDWAAMSEPPAAQKA